MIYTPAFDIGVSNFYEIGPDGFKLAQWAMFKNNYDPAKKDIKRYFAESTSVLLLERKDRIEVIAGAEISDEVVKNMASYAIKNNKPLELRRCESLNNLRIVDHTIQVTNQFLEMFPKIEEFDSEESDT